MRRALAGLLIALPVVALYGVGSGCGRSTADRPYARRAAGTLTFNADIAPIVFESCSSCHRPGGGAPFDLLTYDDVRKRTSQIAVVTGSRYMPPWLPAAGHGEFAGERALSTDEIGMIAQWSEEGSPEGEAGALPPVPAWPEGWTLGPPDLVLELPEAYELAADGPDVYRNFVLSVPLDQPAHVRALEFDPGNPLAVHHAFVLLDPTPRSRRLDEESAGPGFGDLTSMELPDSVVSPGGFFNGWTPGRRAFRGYDDMAWQLDPTSDIVLQLHLRPTGKPERVRPSVALYFAEKPPTRFPLVIGLRSIFIDVPPGETYSFESQYTLPVDVDVLAILPHAHYIATEMLGWAELPDGTTQWLINIPSWDYNWQEDYRYTSPVFLPKGTKITQRYTYDNSSSNPSNPVSPPQRVRFGPSAEDEMGELWLQVVTRRPEERALLQQHFQLDMMEKEAVRKAREALEKDPADGSALLVMAKCRNLQNRVDEAIEYAERAIRAGPQEAEPRYLLGHLLLARGRDDERALEQLTAAIRIRPDLVEAHNELGWFWKTRGDPARAAQAFATAHELAPEDPYPLYNLGVIAGERGDVRTAVAMFQRTLSVDPSHRLARDALAQIEARLPGLFAGEDSE